MTRAADRLVVCGAKGVNKAPAGCWHDLVLGALQSLSEEDSDADGKIWRFRKSVAPVNDSGAPASEKPTALPAWLTTKAPPSPPAPMILRPSEMGDDEPRRVAGRRPRRSAAARHADAPVVAIAAGHPGAAPAKVAGEFLSAKRREDVARSARRIGHGGIASGRRQGFRRAVHARQPGRSADRRKAQRREMLGRPARSTVSR